MLVNMLNLKLSVFSVVGVLCIYLCAGNSNMMKICIETEKQALLKFKDGFIDAEDILSYWKSEIDCCQWKGISCNNFTGHVVKLHVKDNMTSFRGNINPLCELHHLTFLDLSNIDFEGKTIPKCIGSVGQLKELNLGGAGLVGTIPHELGNLSNLQTLDLRHNANLTANDLHWVSDLSSLKYLFLQQVDLSGATDWQSSLSSIVPSLLELHLDGCGLIPQVSPKLFSHINSSTFLKLLDLENNHLNSSILPWVSNVSKVLETLDLSKNSFQHIVPKAFSNMNSLRSLHLSNNFLQQIVIDTFGNMASLQYLDLSNNYLQHIALYTFVNMTSLQDLDLSNNSLQYIAPYTFVNMNSLRILDISCNSLQHIVSHTFGNVTSLPHLDLSNNSLQYIAPDAFTNITSLEDLNLSFNNLESNIVKFICNLRELKYLTLSYNKLFGQLSDWIKQLHCAQDSIDTLNLSENPFSSGPFPDLSRFSSLSKLFLANTRLYGPIPQSFGHLLHLTVMDLSHNKLSGPLPEFTGLSSMEELDLSYNELNEILPSSLGHLSYLSSLYLHSNNLKGVISERHLSTLTSLEVLDVSHNLISFQISSNWIPPFQLGALIASSCILGYDFPTWLKYQKKLSFLDISNCQISDFIPEWFWNVSQGLEYMNISHNKIVGALPKSLAKFKMLPISSYQVWDLSFNKLSGPLPDLPPEVANLFLSNNMFSGSISSICATSLSQLTYLDISSNLLSGNLPDCWEQFSSLQVLNLAKNNFSGRILNSIDTLEKIEFIHLNNNNLSGEIPSFKPSFELKFIDFGQNNLHGKLPTWIGHYLPNLIGLRLHANKLQGNIPASICNLVHLQILDLSQNNITGTIPSCLNSLIALSNITVARQILSYTGIQLQTSMVAASSESNTSVPSWYDTIATSSHDTLVTTSNIIEKAIIAWKGQKVEYNKNLGLMTTVDLSCNHLSGEIPQSLTTLLALASLNLSRNNLTGVVPNNIGEMKMLESLDLSCNSLSGEIPTSFSALTFLSYLNLSFNHLSGQIPQTTQLQTFNASSYFGNQGLCGFPLTQECPNLDVLPRSNHNLDADEDDKLISFGFYVCLAFGFIVGFWGVCGTLILKRSWRRAYFQFLTDMNDWIYVQIVVLRARIIRRFHQ